jgi:outer membrane protein OmpA-like peptidoglycan-associated protein
MQKTVFLVPLFIILSFTIWAQPVVTVENLPKKWQEQYSNALMLIKDQELGSGLSLIKPIITQYSGFLQGWLTIGGVYSSLKQYDSSNIAYDKAFLLDKTNTTPFKLPYSINQAGMGKFKEALATVSDFLAIPGLSEKSIKAAQYRKGCFELALQLQSQQNRGKYQFQPINLGNKVNSANMEYYPSINALNNKIIFNRRLASEDFFQAQKMGNQWVNVQALDGFYNSEFNEGAQTLSSNAKYLVFVGCNFPNGKGSCDLMASSFNGKTWSDPTNLGAPINTEYWESAPSLSPDEQALYFSSNRVGGYGGKDIYVSYRQKSGAWGTPINLGPSINTSGEEASPFIHADNQTLYFLSSGLPGLGGDDLFIAKKLADSSWAKPTNLGYPINTIENEGSLVVANNATTAYFASDRAGGFGLLDLYAFDIPKDISPEATVWLQGIVKDSSTQKGIPALFELADANKNTTLMKVQADEDGNYLVAIPSNKQYTAYIYRKGYLYFNDNFSISTTSTDTFFTRNFALSPIIANKTLEIKNIYFDTKMYEVKPNSQVALQQLIQFLKTNPTVTIEVQGHTDNVGKPKDNLLLSNKRAISIMNYLVINGNIDPKRIAYKGYGSSLPKSKLNTEAGRALNRRTEIKILKP